MRSPRYKTSYSGGYYHIYNRGNQKQDIFLEEVDYIYYLEKLRKYREQQKVSIICYCLMPNHIHLLVRQDSEIPISKFMSPLHTSYSMYFNRKYEKVGHLFQDRFKQKNVENDEYLLQLTCYIHLNPLIDGLVGKLEDYQWSSYPDYIGLRQGTLCDKEPVLLGKSSDWYKRVTEQEVKDQLLKKEFQEQFKDCP
jgi:REP element-mobilizing transposase RayT